MDITHFNLGFVLRVQGLLLFDRDKLRQSEKSFATAVELNPQSSQYHSGLGVVLADRNALNDAVNCFERAIELKPNDATAHVNLGVMLAILNRPTESARHLARAVELHSDTPPGFSSLSDSLKKQEHVQAALEVYRKLHKQYPNDVNVQNVFGNLLIRQNLRDEAILHFQKAVKRHSKDILAWHTLGMLYRDSGDLSAAIDPYQHAADLVPRNGTFQMDFVRTCFAAGEIPRAVSAFQQRFERPNVTLGTYNHLLDLLRYSGDISGYRELCRRMLEEYRDDETGQFSVLRAYYNCAGVEVPPEVLEIARQRVHPPHWQKTFQLAMIHHRMGQSQQALPLLRRLSNDGLKSVHKIQIYLGLTLVQLELNQIDSAEESIRRARSIQSFAEKGGLSTTWEWQPWGIIPALWREVGQELKEAGLDVPIPNLPPAYEPSKPAELELTPLNAPWPILRHKIGFREESRLSS